ncbi:MAG: multi-copper enzyme maturation ABC transporter [Planctomycetota bacterium]|nr:MAG: multi-copper enzyme maturation ABC transporter [Planctomycetota bacterium]
MFFVYSVLIDTIMYKTLVVAAHTAHQSLRLPLFWILTSIFAAMIWTSQYFTMFTLDESLEGLLLREMGISSIALCGALLSVLLSWLVITRDMELLVALTVLSKPLSRAQFLAGKYLGILVVVGFSSLTLSGVLLATLWQKEAGPRIEELSTIEEITYHEAKGDVVAAIESVKGVPEDCPFTAEITLDRELPESASRAARLAARPPDGRFSQGQFVVWKENALRQWLILKSWNENGRGKVVVAVGQPWLAPDGVSPLDAPADPSRARAELPPSSGEARLAPSRHGAAQSAWARFWTFDAAQIAKGALLAVFRVAILLAFAASLAPHVPLVVNGSVSFLIFLMGHVSNYAFLALDTSSHSWTIRLLARIFYAVFPNLENSRVESLVAAGREISPSYVCWSAGYGFAYAALVLVAGAAVFSRKEIR